MICAVDEETNHTWRRARGSFGAEAKPCAVHCCYSAEAVATAAQGALASAGVPAATTTSEKETVVDQSVSDLCHARLNRLHKPTQKQNARDEDC